MHEYLEVLRKYAVFEGRARRREYWMFFLVNVVAVLALALVDGLLGLTLGDDDGVLSTLYQLAVFVPSLAVGVRRMHDTDRSGWWILVPIVNVVFSVLEGDRSENRFGPDPKAIA